MQKPTKTDKRQQKTFILATQIGYIFQSAQAFYKYWECFFIPDVSYDSTHILFCRFVVFDSISAAKLQQKSESTNVLPKNISKNLHKII